jgi:hypothetical protein
MSVPAFERVASWPQAGEAGEYVIGCSCGKWEFVGTVDEINEASRSHDDSPWRSHFVTIRGRVIADAK